MTLIHVSFYHLNPEPGALGVFIIFQKVNKLMGLFTLTNLSLFQKVKLGV